MGRRRGRGDRGRRREATRPKTSTRRERTHRDPRFGTIPLVERQVTLVDGGRVTITVWDPSYEPPLPAGAVRGDITKQEYGLGRPLYFYEDEERTCLQCGRPFVFSAKEQKHWYEVLGFVMRSTAVRCLRCRRQRRSDNALRRQLAEARLAPRSRRGPTTRSRCSP